MADSALKTLTGSARLAVVDEAPAGSVQFDFSNVHTLTMHSCEEPFISDRQPLSSFRRLVPTDG